ncbi:hypothetical protein D3C85_1563040 [compost metagenome]
MRRYIVHDHRRNATDIDAHLHGSRAVQNVDLAIFEHLFIGAEAFRGLLGRVLSGTVIVATLHYPIIDIRPQVPLS